MSYLLTEEILQRARSNGVRLVGHTERDQYKRWKCSTHGLFTRTISGVRNGSMPCPECSEEHRVQKMVSSKEKSRIAREQKSLETLLSRFKHLSVVRTSADSRITFNCSRCDTEFSQTPGFLLRRRKYGCPQCGILESSKQTIHARRQSKYKRNKERLNRVVQKLKQYPLLRLIETVEPKVGKIRFRVQCVQCLTTSARTEQTIMELPEHTTGCKLCSSRKNADRRFVTSLDHTRSILKRYKSLSLVQEPSSPDSEVKFKCLDCGHCFKSSVRLIVDSVRQCPECKPKTWRPRKKQSPTVSVSSMVYVDGNEFEVRGTEKATLLHLLKIGFRANDIRTNTFARRRQSICIPYKFLGKAKKHFPDFHVRSRDLVIESKSPYTLGIEGDGKRSRVLDMNRAKAKAAVEIGLNYRVAVVTPEIGVVFLPKTWYLWDLHTLKIRFDKHVSTK